MRKLAVFSILSFVFLVGATHKVVTPDAIKWGDAPPNLPKGAKLAVLEGDPAKKGIFVVRLQMPDGYKVAPHWHPTRERYTVLSGTLHIGMGDTLDTSKGDALPAGSFGYMNAKMHHYAWTTGETLIEISAMGPLALNYVNPKDDPSKSASK